MVLRQGMQPAALGLAAGLVLTLALGRLASSLLFQVSPRDPAIMAAGTALLAVVALIAVSLPARRASRVDPVKALRVE
jgi:ABC-type antimicrobial peptide transport system permease subunit